MYAFVKGNSGNIYQSLVFGCYKDDSKYNNVYDTFYYIVFNETKTELIKQYVYDKSSKYIKLQILITDCDKSDWKMIDDYCGQINIFEENLPKCVEEKSLTKDLLEKCISLDKNYQYNEFHTIKTDIDIKNLDWSAGNFHDSYISKIEINKENDELYVLFEGCWGCSIEIWFSNIVNFNIHVDDILADYWSSSNMYFENGYFCLINDNYYKISEATKGFTWFSSKEAKYRINPLL